jgi:hypothetical protein
MRKVARTTYDTRQRSLSGLLFHQMHLPEVVKMKKFCLAMGTCLVATLLVASPAGAFSTARVAPIRKIPINAQDADTGKPGVWATGAVYTKCGAIGVDSVFYNNSSNPTINTGQQTYTVSIQINVKGAWIPVKGSEVKSYRPNHQHRRYEYDEYINVGWHYKYRVMVTNNTSAPLLGTMWVNAAANDNNPADNDKADCQ